MQLHSLMQLQQQRQQLLQHQVPMMEAASACHR